jgi:hypothetical protein
MYKSTNNIEPYKSDVTVTTDVEVKREMNVEVIQSGIIENVITVSTENVNTELNQCVDDMLSGL